MTYGVERAVAWVFLGVPGCYISNDLKGSHKRSLRAAVSLQNFEGHSVPTCLFLKILFHSDSSLTAQASAQWVCSIIFLRSTAYLLQFISLRPSSLRLCLCESQIEWCALETRNLFRIFQR
jgi:hypothetical protein